MTHVKLELCKIFRIKEEKKYKRASAFINNTFLTSFVGTKKGPIAKESCRQVVPGAPGLRELLTSALTWRKVSGPGGSKGQLSGS